MGEKERRVKIRAVTEHIEDACEFVSQFARDMGLSDDAVYHCYLAIEEICTNIIEHGYKFKGQNNVIDIICTATSDSLRIVVIDDAAKFNPLLLADPDPSAPLLEREGGGWGVFFVKKFMDRISYRYEHNRNHFILEKVVANQ